MKRLTKLSNLVMAAMLTCCVEPINFERPDLKPQLVVDGYISNLPGPYTISLSRSRAVVGNQALRTPVLQAVVKIHSDAEEVETLVEKPKEGIYASTQIQGVVGRSYWITIQLPDGSTYESTPEIIKSPGTIDLVQYEFEHRTKVVNGVPGNDDRLNILVDATTSPESENFYRWRVTGTYKVETRPDLITKDANDKAGSKVPDPPKCSGWAVNNSPLSPNKGTTFRYADCTCCTCWVTNYEEEPRVTYDEFLQGDQFREVKIGTVPVSPATFFDKYHVAIDQMALTKSTFDYFRLIRAQKEGVTSLFQPVSGKIRGNVTRTDVEEEVLGLFYAAGTSSYTHFIEPEDLPVFPGVLEPILKDCRHLGGKSTTTKPDFW